METTAVLQKTKWKIDPMHSEVQFKVKHLLISTLTGSFKTFNGEVTTQSDDFENAKIEFSIEANSLTSNLEIRDKQLKGAEFFDVENHPFITFRSTTFLKSKRGGYILSGTLTIKGISKEIRAIVDFGGFNKDSRGNAKAGFELTATISRRDFGINYNKLTAGGDQEVSEDVLLQANIQVAKEQE